MKAHSVALALLTTIGFACASGQAVNTDGSPNEGDAGEAGASGGTAAGASGSGEAGAGKAGGGHAGAAGTGGAGASGEGGATGGSTTGGAGGDAGAGGSTTGGAGGDAGAGGSTTGGAGGDAGGATGGGAGAGGAPCVCDDPPFPVCLADGTTRRSFASPGTCSGPGSCTYPHADETCPYGCAGGKCVSDPCTSVSCSTPPPPVCSGESVRTYSAPGTCTGTGACSYPSTDGAPCAFGCANGACKADPCASVTCQSPPAKTCNNASVRTYAATGTCSNGVCDYTYSDAPPCDFGCANGACKPDPCAGVSCDTVPLATCLDANTLRTPTGAGSCSQATGKCQYPSTDTPCPGGCTSSVCKECASASHCSPGMFCNAGTCAACGPSACGNGMCDCGETESSCPGDCKTCPTALSLGAWTSGNDDWSLDGLWYRGNGVMNAGSGNKYNSSYEQHLTYGKDVDLSTCPSPTLSFNVSLSDDANYSPRADKSERLYVRCSGDGGASWTDLTPTSWPKNQSSCGVTYCNGGSDRSFPTTAQTLTVPGACRTAKARFRFTAKGSSVWRMMNPAWTVSGVKVN